MALTEKLTAIAEALRRNLGMADKITLDRMPGEIDRVYEKAEEDFWDKVPQEMDRYHFAGDGWNVDNFYPRGRYVCVTGNPQYVFAYHNRRHAPYDFAQRIADSQAEFVFLGATKLDYGFYCANITTLPPLNLSNHPAAGHVRRLLRFADHSGADPGRSNGIFPDLLRLYGIGKPEHFRHHRTKWLRCVGLPPDPAEPFGYFGGAEARGRKDIDSGGREPCQADTGGN